MEVGSVLPGHYDVSLSRNAVGRQSTVTTLST